MQKRPVPAFVPPKSFCQRALNWDKLTLGEVVPSTLGLVRSLNERVPSHGPEPTVAGLKFRTGGNRLRRAQSSRGNGGGGSTESDLCCLSYLLFKKSWSGAAGDPFSLSKKDPHPGGDDFCSRRGSYPRRRAPRTLNLLRTQTKAHPVILPRQTSVADPEFPCAWKQLLKFLLPKARDSHPVAPGNPPAWGRSIRWQELPPFHLGPKLRLRPREIVACRRRRCHGSFE